MRKLSCLTVLSALALMACSGRNDTADIARFEGEMPIQGPWVRERLPRGTQVYLRIAHPLGLLAAPKGNMFDPALASEAHVRNLLAIQQGLIATLTANPAMPDDPRARLLLDHLQSPVEVAATLMPLPTVLVGMTLDLRDRSAFEALFGELSQLPPLPRLAAPLDDAGFAELVGLPVPALVHFDAASGRLALFGGASANRASLETLLGSGGANPDHPMAELERQIDSSGQGFFSWLDTSELMALGGLAAPPEVGAMLRSTGAAGLKAVAFGLGVADGKGRLKLVADVGGLVSGRPFPVIANDVSARSAGDPTSLFLLSIPDPAEFARLEQLALGFLPPEAREGWSTAKEGLRGALGVSIEDIFNAVGPELVSWSDEAGEFAALKLRDRELFADLLSRLAASAGSPIEDRRIEGQTIRAFSLPGIPGIRTDAMPAEAAPWLTMLSRLRTRLYFVEDGDYVYFAALPQLLVDRHRLDADTDIGDWLEETQRLDLSTALVAGTGTVASLPRKNYQFYVTAMQQLADLVGADYDVWSMPTATDLALPDRSSLGFSVNLGSPYVSIELAYESHPFEVLLGSGGLAAVAGAGIAAAIAIPAYQDYTIRVQVSEGLNLAAAAKAAVAESYLATAEAPADRAAAGLTPEPGDTQGRYVAALEIVDGTIVVRFGNAAHPEIAGDTLTLRPYRDAGAGIHWVCGWAAPLPGATPLGEAGRSRVTTIAPQYLPSACR